MRRFRPDLVEQHLKVVAERVRRRRLALLREDRWRRALATPRI